MPAEFVIIAAGMKPTTDLYQQLQAKNGARVCRVGDCVSPGKIFDAIHTAYRLALTI